MRNTTFLSIPSILLPWLKRGAKISKGTSSMHQCRSTSWTIMVTMSCATLLWCCQCQIQHLVTVDSSGCSKKLEGEPCDDFNFARMRCIDVAYLVEDVTYMR